jgi:hypothetical protein
VWKILPKKLVSYEWSHTQCFLVFQFCDVTEGAIIPKMICKFENMKVKNILASFYIFGYLLELRIGSGDSFN